MPDAPIAFNVPYLAPAETDYILEAVRSGHTTGDGPFTRRATAALRSVTGADAALLTTSCTSALDLSALLLDLGPGDEVIVPSFTFSSTATAIVQRGATPVFADITPGTLNLDPAQAELAVTPRTKAIFLVHYGGVACDMTALGKLAEANGLAIVEDNAHGLGARVDGRQLGSFGALATQSFHGTKNISCGEGGALLVNDPTLRERAEILREKGTNRSRFLRGMVDKYTWVDQGSSWLPSDVLAAMLLAQLEAFQEIQAARHRVWSAYERGLAAWAAEQGVQLPVVPAGAEHPAHVFQLVLPGREDQAGLISTLAAAGISAVFHYLPLHSSPAGRRFGRAVGSCEITERVSDGLVRLPLHARLTDSDIERVVSAVTSYRTGA